MESDARYYRRRLGEEIAAADRAVTPAARERRLQLASLYRHRLEAIGAAPEDRQWRVCGSAAARKQAELA